MRPWIIRSGATVVASLAVVAISWGPTDAYFRRHHRSQVVPLSPTSRGIIPTKQGPFSSREFLVSNGYVGPLGSGLVTVYAGVKLGPDGSAQAGGVRVFTRPADSTYRSGDTYVGEFLAPMGPDFLTILAVEGSRVVLGYQGSHTVVFDLNRDSFQ